MWGGPQKEEVWVLGSVLMSMGARWGLRRWGRETLSLIPMTQEEPPRPRCEPKALTKRCGRRLMSFLSLGCDFCLL